MKEKGGKANLVDVLPDICLYLKLVCRTEIVLRKHNIGVEASNIVGQPEMHLSRHIKKPTKSATLRLQSKIWCVDYRMIHDYVRVAIFFIWRQVFFRSRKCASNLSTN